MRELRENSGLSFRQLARLVHYSHTYLWDIETGRKQPTPEMAAALDAAFDAGGVLAELVTESPDAVGVVKGPGVYSPLPLDTDRHHLEELAQRAHSDSSDLATRKIASLWARYASFLYDTFVRSRPPLLRLGSARYSRHARNEAGTSPFRMEVLRQGRTPTVECRSVTRQPAPPKVSDRLSLEAGQPVIRREKNWYYADAELIQLGVTYVPPMSRRSRPSPGRSSSAVDRCTSDSRIWDIGSTASAKR